MTDKYSDSKGETLDAAKQQARDWQIQTRMIPCRMNMAVLLQGMTWIKAGFWAAIGAWIFWVALQLIFG